jgi:hypothetical protein
MPRLDPGIAKHRHPAIERRILPIESGARELRGER